MIGRFGGGIVGTPVGGDFDLFESALEAAISCKGTNDDLAIGEIRSRSARTDVPRLK